MNVDDVDAEQIERRTTIEVMDRGEVEKKECGMESVGNRQDGRKREEKCLKKQKFDNPLDVGEKKNLPLRLWTEGRVVQIVEGDQEGRNDIIPGHSSLAVQLACRGQVERRGVLLPSLPATPTLAETLDATVPSSSITDGVASTMYLLTATREGVEVCRRTSRRHT